MPARFFERRAVIQSANLKQGGQLVLQATRSPKSPKTLNTEIQRGLVQSATPHVPHGPLQNEVDHHF